MIEPKFYLGLPPEARMIRQKVFIDEQHFKEEFTGDDEGCWCLVLFHDEKPIATGRIQEVDPETYRVGRVAVLKEYRGKKIGSYLLKFLEVKIKSLGGRKAILAARYDKRDFYLKQGYKFADDGEVFYEEYCPHINMEKILVRPNKSRYQRFPK